MLLHYLQSETEWMITLNYVTLAQNVILTSTKRFLPRIMYNTIYLIFSPLKIITPLFPEKNSSKNFTCPLGEQRPHWEIYKLIFLTPLKTWFHNHHSKQTIFLFTLESLSTFAVLVTFTNSKGGTNHWWIKFFSKNSNDGRGILVNKLLALLKQVKIDFTQLHITR